MKILICGAGRTTRELLRRLGEGWEVTLIDPRPDQLARATSLFPRILSAVTADASSELVLKKAGIADHDYVLAMTGDDEVNLAVVGTAAAQGVTQISALVRDEKYHKSFAELGVHTFMGPGLVAQNIYHYLQDPRLHVTPLVSGPGAVYEVNASSHFRVVGKRASYFSRSGARLAAIIRRDQLLFPRPKTPILADDRLIIVGKPDIFEPVCELLECGNPHFPLAYGQGMLLALGEREPESPSEFNPILSEGLFLAQNTKVAAVTVLCPGRACPIDEHLAQWPQNTRPEVRPLEGGLRRRLRELCAEGNYGLVVVPQLGVNLFETLAKAPLVELAGDLDTPLLVARFSVPYERILVPFNGTAMSELALEVAVDLSRQLHAEVSAAVVEEPEFLSGQDEEARVQALLTRLRELAHIHKVPIREVRRRGNPVKELVALSAEYELLVLGSTNRGKGLLAPNIGDHLARKAQCSVLLLAM
ncbi:MAG: NAD-binding protein [Desulfovibrionaceae bacterium]